MERAPVEIWQQILLKAVETGEGPIFMTSCTPYTFLYFVNQQTCFHRHRKPYFDYQERRRRLRLVCRAWNEFVLLSRHRWLQLVDEGSPIYGLDSTTPGAGGVRPVERLSTKINSDELVVPILSWTSHILQRPADQSPLRAYALRLYKLPTQGYNPFYDLVRLAPDSPEYTNTALESLSIAALFGSTVYISFPQISSTFTGLRSLFLWNMIATPRQTIALPQLELLHVHYTTSAFHTLPVHVWDTPALRHAYLAYLSTRAQFAAVLDGFLRRHAARLESLVLFHDDTKSASLLGLPVDFWYAFPALRLFGVKAVTLERQDWAGWTVVPPTTHPLRYLVCWSSSPPEASVDRVRPRWTYHEGVKLVATRYASDSFHLVNSVRDEQWIATMETTCGILPEL